MDCKNGFKTIYDVVEERDNEKVRVFKASKTGTLEDAIEICCVPCGEYKLVYEKNGSIYASTTGLVEDGVELTEFNTIFKEADETEETGSTEPEVTTTPDDETTPDDTTVTDTTTDLDDTNPDGTEVGPTTPVTEGEE